MLKTHIAHTAVAKMDIDEMRILRACFNGTTCDVDHDEFFESTIEAVSEELDISETEAENRLKPYVFARIDADTEQTVRNTNSRLKKSMIQYAQGDPTDGGK